eukprot:TRINITY_DN61672_c0_g1_i1.p1 TRINITY_DN61672_c0_g1~~TRINITY_DN61672_c0_g1_i1.p1  ORF type:complete len:291 (+),score=44.35 TRINITY_DN61672_c0_g1_i1:49-921(+)
MVLTRFAGIFGSFGVHVEVAATVFAIFFLLSPAADVIKVCKTKGDALVNINPFNLISMYGNCAMWLIYGIFYPVPHAVPCNALGLLACCVYLLVCWVYAVRKSDAHGWHLWCVDGSWSRSAALGTLSALTLSMLCCIYAAMSQARAEHIGYLAMAVNVVMYGAPLSAIGRVVADKSSASLPPLQCGLGFCCSFAWLCVGLHNSNIPTIIPNSLGVPLAVLQLSLICWFPRSVVKVKAKQEEPGEEPTKQGAGASEKDTAANAAKETTTSDGSLRKRGRAQSPGLKSKIDS